MKLTGAQIVWESMVREGVDTIFGISGGAVIHLYHALPDYPIHHVLTRHEQGAAFMADVYGRLTGKAGVCLATLGPGATNLITGFADAKMTRAGDFYQESIKDTVKMLEYYGDVIAMRHYQQGAPHEAAKWSSIPVINAGDGGHSHPTQAMLDIYTLLRSFEPRLGTTSGMAFKLHGRVGDSPIIGAALFVECLYWLVAGFRRRQPVRVPAVFRQMMAGTETWATTPN